jgi:hypothetical protein
VIKRPKIAALANCPPTLRLNVVTVQEADPPRGEKPVCWRLLTTEPIDSAVAIEGIVDHYRARWVIEEFFKALKTGCAFEKRQLESFRALVNALAIFSVIAWRLLLLRSVVRRSPEAPAEDALTARQVKVLQTVSKIRGPGVPRVDIPSTRPTAQDALYAVAQLGGHLKNNGWPGWQVLGLGYDSLLLVELGWIAREASRT